MEQLDGFHHVKVPVTDVARSRDWYGRVLGLETEIEFVEDGVLMGVAMGDPGGTLQLALRAHPELARAIKGFDPIAFAVPTRAELEKWQARLDELGERHGGIVEGHVGWLLVGLHDPDGIEVRLYTREEHGRSGG